MRARPTLQIPADTLVDDAWISYLILQKGSSIGYVPEAKVKVIYPNTFRDFIKQKRRSAGGYIQLKKDPITQGLASSRSFGQELKMVLFPIMYAKNIRQLWWSLWMYPLRLIQWLVIFYDQRLARKDLMKSGGWERIESTK